MLIQLLNLFLKVKMEGSKKRKSAAGKVGMALLNLGDLERERADREAEERLALLQPAARRGHARARVARRRRVGRDVGRAARALRRALRALPFGIVVFAC